MIIKAFILVATLMVIVGGALCYRHFSEDGQLGIDHKPSAARPWLAQGRVAAHNTAKIAFVIPGKITDVSVREGDAVENGAALCRLDSSKQELATEQIDASLREVDHRIAGTEVDLAKTTTRIQLDQQAAETQIRVAERELKQAESDFARGDRLVGREAAAVASRESLQTARDLAQMKVDSMKISLEQALNERRTTEVLAENLAASKSERDSLQTQKALSERILADHTASSPIDGTVLLVRRKQGEVVSAGEPIMEVADLGSLYFEADVSEEWVDTIDVGAQVCLRLTGSPRPVIRGTVARIDDASKESVKLNLLTEEEENREYRLTIEFLESDLQGIKLGMRGEVEPSTESPRTTAGGDDGGG